MSDSAAFADRLGVLHVMSAEEIASLLAALPHVAVALVPPLNRRKIATALVDGTAMMQTLQMLSPQAVQVLGLARAIARPLTEADLVRQLGTTDPRVVDGVLQELAARLLIDRDAGYVFLRPGVADFVRLGGRSLRESGYVNQLTNGELVEILHRHGQRLGGGLADHVNALVRLFADGDAVRRTVATMSAGAQVMMDQLLEAGPVGCTFEQVGVGAYQLRLAVLYRRPGTRDPSVESLLELLDMGFVSVDEYDGRIALWRELIASLSGVVGAPLPPGEPIDLVALDHQGAHPPTAPSTLASVLRAVRCEPIIGLKTGGVGVKALRDLARQLGHSEQQVSIVFGVGQLLGLIEEQVQSVGSGRTASVRYQYAISREADEAFSAQPLAEQWQQMVTAWLGGSSADSSTQFMTATIRQLLADLVDLEAGAAVPEAKFQAWVGQRHFGWRVCDATAVIEELRALALVPASGPVALTPLSRALLTEPQRVAEMLPDLDDSFVVQADHTVVAPPTLHPAVRSQLEAISVLTSDSSVRVHRLDPQRIAAALARNDTAESLLDWLALHSSVPLPDAVRQLILDTDRQRGGLQVSVASTVVTAGDVLGLASALKVKAAQLTMIAPTVAISPLPPTRVLTALRAKGLAPKVSEGVMSVGSKTPIYRVPTPKPEKSTRPLILSRSALLEMAKQAR